MSNLKKISTSLFIALFLFVSLIAPHAALAQTSAYWWEPNFQQFAAKVAVTGNEGSPPTEIFGERYTYAQVSWIINSLVSILGGPIGRCASNSDQLGCLLTELRSNPQGQGPILTTLALADAIGGSRPASGVDYVAQKLEKVKIIDTVHAQAFQGGYGFSKSLLPIQPLWVASRNAAFALTTFAIIILAFMIMFRAKISPQVVISAQSALPKVAIGLIFITFSYAIAGFLIDLAFVVQGIIAAVVSASGVVGTNLATGAAIGPLEIFNQMQDSMGSLFAYGLAFLFSAIGGQGVLVQALNVPPLATVGIFPVLDTIIALILLVVLFISSCRILWLLILTYGKIVFLVLGGPFFALMAIAGQGSGIGGWAKKIAAELGVFVALGVLVMFAHVIFYSFGNGNNSVNLMAQLNPVLKVNINPYGVKIPDQATLEAMRGTGLMPSGFNFSGTTAIGFFVSLAIVVSIPKLASAVRDQMNTGRGAYGSGIGEAFSPVTGRMNDYAQYRLDRAINERKRVAGQFADTTALSNLKSGFNWLSGRIK